MSISNDFFKIIKGCIAIQNPPFLLIYQCLIPLNIYQFLSKSTPSDKLFYIGKLYPYFCQLSICTIFLTYQKDTLKRHGKQAFSTHFKPRIGKISLLLCTIINSNFTFSSQHKRVRQNALSTNSSSLFRKPLAIPHHSAK